MTEQYFIREAMRLGRKNHKKGGQPYGAVIVKGGEVIARGVNEVNDKNDPVAHAEIMAIQEAAQKLNTSSLEGCQLYASNEPCAMCLAATYWANIREVYFAVSASSHSQFIYEEMAKQPQHRSISMKQLDV